MKKREFNFEKIHNFLEQNVNVCPNNIGIETPYTKLTYEELSFRVLHLCSSLLKNNVKKGDRIALLSKNDSSFCELMFACSILNLVLVLQRVNYNKIIQEVFLSIKQKIFC